MVLSNRRVAVAGLTGAAAAVLSRGASTQTAVPDAVANEAVVRRLFGEVYNDGNLDALDELLSPEFVGDDPNAAPGVEGYKRSQATVRSQYERFFRAFQWEMTDVAAEGPLVFVRMTFTGTRLDDGEPDVSTQGFLEASVTDGKITRIWSLVDVAALTAQLGD